MIRWAWASAQEFAGAMNRRMKALENVLGAMQDEMVGVGVWEDGDTTPSVVGARHWQTANTSGTNVTALDNDGQPGVRYIHFKDTNTTLVHGSNLVLSGAVNFTGSVGDVKHIVSDDGTTWREV